MKRSPMPRRRTPLRAGEVTFKRTELQRAKTRMKQVSDKRRSRADERAAVVALVRSRDRSCRAAHLVPDRPCGGPLDVHERIQRSLWAAGYLDPDNCLLVCRSHHQWIDEHIEQAHAVGLLRHSWERP